MPLVFVYGTLKRGGRNHAHLSGQYFLGPARTQPGYTLYQPADYPGMVPVTADRDGVTGELCRWMTNACVPSTGSRALRRVFMRACPCVWSRRMIN